MFKATFRIKIYLPNKKFFLSFLDFEQNLFGLLTGNFCALFSQLQLHVHSNVFIRNIFCEKIFFPKSYAEFFHVLVRKFTTELTKVHFLCPKDVSWKKKFFKKNLLSIYGFWANCFWDSAWSFNRVSKNSQFVLENFFEQKYLFRKKV